VKKLIEIATLSLLPFGIVFVLCLHYEELGWFYFCFLPSLLISGLAAYMTSLACRLAHQRRWRLPWYLGLSAVMAATVLAGGSIWLFISLQPGSWGKSDPVPFFLWICASGVAFGLLPAELIVRHYRKKIGDVTDKG